MGESNVGRIVDSAVFQCDPCSGPLARVELRIQARVGVVIRTVRRLPRVGSQPGQLLDLEWPDCIALTASGGHTDQWYFWVQIFSDEPERITDFDGTERTEDINTDSEPTPVSAENAFSWAGRRWSVDARTPESARYVLRLPTVGSPNCETMYDAPSATEASLGWMVRNPPARRVAKTTQFHSFLYHLPVLAEERQRVFLARLQPDASVAWSFDQAWERTARGAEPRRVEQRYRVHYIHPNGIVPPGMTRVIWRVFHGR